MKASISWVAMLASAKSARRRRLSEGVNLQESFDAVLHYDLPWNPNRLEQREGRVDRFGQPKPTVRAAVLYGPRATAQACR